jgi:hypothetical protein
VLTVLAPEQTGWTSKDRPKLFWYLSRPVNARVEFTVSGENSVRPLIEKTISARAEAGIHSFDLATQNAKLAPHVEYRWSVALVTDDAQRSTDVVSSGAVLYMPPAGDGRSQFGAAREESPSAYASNAYWYDDVERLSPDLENPPSRHAVAEARIGILEQANLKEVADYFRQ